MNDVLMTASAIQLVSGPDIDQNLETTFGLMDLAVCGSDTNLLVLPECFALYGRDGQSEVASRFEEIQQRLSVWCQNNHCSVLAGTIPNQHRPDNTLLDSRLRACSLLIDQQGEIAARYDKIHLFDVDIADSQKQYRESDDYEAGESVSVVSLDAGGITVNVGLSVCYDLRFPELFQKLRRDGADVILLPSAFTEMTGRAHWEVLLRARAIETQCYIVAANQGGRHSSRRSTWGHSMIIDPWGRIVKELEHGEGWISAQLDLDLLAEVRHSIPLSEHKRLELFQG